MTAVSVVQANGDEDEGPRVVPDDQPDAVRREVVGGFQVIGSVVNYNQTPSFADATARIIPGTEVYPGQFLGVLHSRGHAVLTIVQVSNAFEVNPNEAPELSAAREALGLDRGYGLEGVSTRIYRLAECTAKEEFDLDQSGDPWRVRGDSRAPQLLPRAGDLVALLPPELVIAAMGTKLTADEGLSVGETAGVQSVPVVFDPIALQFGMLICGNPGKGKSYYGGVVLEEAAAWGVPALVLDINGEFADAVRELGGDVITLPDSTRFGLSLDLITPLELVEITPNVQAGTVYAELIELAHDRLRSNARGPITFDQLRATISEIGESTRAPRASIGAAVARVSTLERDPLMGGTYDFIAELERHRIVALDCRFLSLRQTRLIAAMAARELQRIGRERARAAEAGDAEAAKWFAIYLVDEAHAVIPEDEHVVSTQVHFELARMGRHVRTGLILSSQSPADLNSSVLKRLQSRFIFALERDQLRSIQGVMADLDERIVAQLPKLPRGTCAVSGSSDVVRHGFLLRVRERETRAGGSTPRVFDGRVKRSRATPDA